MSAMANRSEDEALVARFCRGEDSAFDRIVEVHEAEVAALAYRLLGWRQDADDVVQEVFIAAFKGLKRFRGDCSLHSWLFTITISKCRTHRFRRFLRLRRVPIEDDELHPSSGRGADGPAIEAENAVRVREAVRNLPVRYREAIVLRYLQGMEPAEICELLRISNNVLQVRLNRARKQLKEAMSKWMERER
jgi:RNA polymerase sigma-70 factor, ECF subfamily